METAYKILEESRLEASKIANLFNKERQLVEVILREFMSNMMLQKALTGNLTKSEYIKRNLDCQDLLVLLNDYSDHDKIPFEKVFEIERGIKFDSEKVLKLEGTRNELISILKEYNRLQALKKGLSGITGNYETREALLRKLLENFFGLEQAFVLLQQAAENLNLTVSYKKGEYSWLDEIEISTSAQNELDELISSIVKFKTDDFEKIFFKSKSFDEYVKDYYEDYTAAMGKTMTNEMIKSMRTHSVKLFEGFNKHLAGALQIAGGFLAYVPPELPADRRRPF
ncbi:MAG: hypothetical protein LBJ74_03465, partial [Heliobacteriaceae bacterium]|nr:hypothetical protein [Heliobacteriaceae bacterium]